MAHIIFFDFLFIKVALVVKDLPANAGNIRDADSIPGSGISPSRGHGNPLQYSCPENSMDRREENSTVHGATKSQTRMKQLSTLKNVRKHSLLMVH